MWYKVAELDELKDGNKCCIKPANHNLVLVHIKQDYYALDNHCPHRGGQLCDGSLKKDSKTPEIICGLHNWNFDLKTGISPYNPQDKVQTYPVAIRTDGIYVEIIQQAEQPLGTEYLDPYRRPIDNTETEMDTIHKMAKGWIGQHGSTEAMRTIKQDPLWHKLVFLPAQVTRTPLLNSDPVSLETIIGKKAKYPLIIDLPVYISHMSFGAISKEAKIALAKGSQAVGTMICSGEGGMLPEERANASIYILELASGYFGWNKESIAQADAIEIKMGQAAKAGMGGTLLGSKVTDEIAKIRGLKKGQDAFSPAHIPDISNITDLKNKVAEIRKLTNGKPVGIKFAATRIEADLKAAISCNPDFITIDGRGGATGAAPKHVKDNICIPTLYALARAKAYFDQHNIKDIDLLITGGLRLPSDFAKAIALGATAVASASASLMAIGCQQYRACQTGKCPVGIATQDLYYRQRFDIEKSTTRLSNFFNTTKWQLADFTRICGYKNIHDLSINDLRTTDLAIAKYTNILHIGSSG